MKWSTILAFCVLLKSDSPLNWSTLKSLPIWLNGDVLTSVTPAKFCQRLSLLYIIITSFTQSKVLTRKRRIIVIKKTIQRNHVTVCHFCIALIEDAIFGYWPLPRFSFVPNTDLKDGFCNFLLSYVSRTVLFFAIQICSLLHLGDEKQCKT